MYIIEPLDDNVHSITLKENKVPTFHCSDIHLDSDKCKRDLLKHDFDQIKDAGGLIFIYGDLLDIMGTYGDRRMRREGLDPQFIVKGRSYIDVVIDYTIEFLKPYAENIAFLSYGNHECYHPDTDVLTSNGWVNIKDVTTNDLVATFNDRKIYFEYPEATVSKEVDNFYKIEGQSSCQNVSGKHAVVLNDLSKVNAEDISEIRDKDVPFGMIEDKESKINNSLLEVITAVVMDGTIVDRTKYGNTDAKRIQFKISKPKKIEYIKSILDKADIQYTLKEATKSPTNKLQPYYIRIYGDDARMIFKELGGVKDLPLYYSDLDSNEFDRFLDVIENTDGYKSNKNTLVWTTTSKWNLDIVQMAATLNGYLFSYFERYNSGFKDDGKLQYICYIRKGISKNRKMTIDKTGGGTAYCLQMPSGRFVTRYNGKVAFSGNTTIQDFHDTDPLRRIVYTLNQSPKVNIGLGAYAGWLIFKMKGRARDLKLHYHHGFGGSAKRSKGVLNVQLEVMRYPDADLLVRGHTHQKWYDPSTARQRITAAGTRFKDKVKYLQMGSYKDGLKDGHGGFEVKKNFAPTDIGGWNVYMEKVRIRKGEFDYEHIKTTVTEQTHDIF